MIKCVPAILLYVFGLANVYGQMKTDKQVLIQGRVLDTVENRPVAAATITVYQKANRKILKYGFTNNDGTFSLPDIPLADSVFLLQISHLGYAATELDARLLAGKTAIGLGDIGMGMEAIMMEEVTVNRPPIVMNQDTLEINPEAFELQPNAVIEDLLTKVPGIVVWGDGVITVNGKRVARVLVEGKPFFGSDPAIATRNLPSNAIDKVRVYDSPTNAPHKEEQLEMDIILKNTKKKGLFGKISAGKGTTGRHEGVLLLNHFDPKNQISLFAGGNNTNKVVRNVTDFLAANVYKAGGENLDSNTPMLGQTGLTNFFIAGTKFQRTWNDRLSTTLELLDDNKDTEIQRNVQERRSFEDGRQQHITESQYDNNHSDRQSFRGIASYRDKKQDLRINSGIQRLKTFSDRTYDRQVTDGTEQYLSQLNKDMHHTELNRTGNLVVDYHLRDSISQILELSYKLNTENHNLEQQEAISFSDNGIDPATHLDRTKQNSQRSDRHELKADIHLNRMLNRPISWSLNLGNQLVIDQSRESQLDRFFDTLTNGYTIENHALSYSDRFRAVEWTPKITLTRGMVKPTAQGHNSLQFTTALGLQTSSRKNDSDNSLRQLDQHFLFVLPSANVRYERNRQLSNNSLSLAYETLIHHPQRYQLIALLDTTQKDFNRVGNQRLKPEEQYQFSLEYLSNRSVNSVSHRLRFEYTLRNNQLVDSSTYLADGGQLSQTVNAAGLPFFKTNYQYRSAQKVWGRPLSIELMAQLNGGQHYFYNNGTRYKNRQVSSWLRARTYYGLLDQLDIGLLGSLRMDWNAYDSRRTQTDRYSLGLDAVLKWPKRTTFISRLLTNRFYTTGLAGEQQYLWNMEVYYRLLKKEQLEIKFSAYDILKNNRAIRNVLRENTVRQTTINNIQQFFMISLSYYPRKF